MHYNKTLIEEKLTDYEFFTLYNPYYHELKLSELYADKEDLYYQSTGRSIFDPVNGITFTAMRMDKILDEILAVDSRIEEAENAYINRVAVLDTLPAHEQDILIQYFYEQFFNHYNIQSSVIDDLKVRLYFIELDSRQDRNIQKKSENERLKRIENHVYEEPERETMIIF